MQQIYSYKKNKIKKTVQQIFSHKNIYIYICSPNTKKICLSGTKVKHKHRVIYLIHINTRHSERFTKVTIIYIMLLSLPIFGLAFKVIDTHDTQKHSQNTKTNTDTNTSSHQ